MGSFQEKMKNMPRVVAEAGEMIVIETKRNGITICEVVCYVDELSYNVTERTTNVRLNVFNPNIEGINKITGYELNNLKLNL